MQLKLSLREARDKLGITQQDLADKLDVTRTYIGLIENGKKPFSDILKRKLLKVTAIGDIQANGATVNNGIIGHNGTVTTHQQSERDSLEEIRDRLSAIETDLTLIKKLLAQQP